ncbi:hypothetical protein HC891_25625 [Candidatus Gracilibacteria bacterium]|nr:hypothetical protein [Candidatus Gracilibacteria bacterium]
MGGRGSSVASQVGSADFLPDIQWFIARGAPGADDGLVLAAKGGHNAEPHNQNDVGSFVVHWRGETLLADLGAMRYTRDNFRSGQRYQMFANRSLGHNVPLVQGYEQVAGPGGANCVRWEVGADSDSFVLDLAGAYPPDADVQTLERKLTLRRALPHGCVELCDRARFQSGPGTFASVLISLVPAVLIEPGRVLLSGERGRLLVHFDAELLDVTIETIGGVDLRGGPRDVTRVILNLRMAALEPLIALEFFPLV